jgi:hypothetical protein
MIPDLPDEVWLGVLVFAATLLGFLMTATWTTDDDDDEE